MQIKFFPDEEWLELPQDSRYLISTHGRLYDAESWRLVPLSTSTVAKVPSYSIRDRRPGHGSPNRYIKVARSVLEAFRGGANPGADVGYLDGDQTNTRLDNLAWVPRQVPARV